MKLNLKSLNESLQHFKNFNSKVQKLFNKDFFSFFPHIDYIEYHRNLWSGTWVATPKNTTNRSPGNECTKKSCQFTVGLRLGERNIFQKNKHNFLFCSRCCRSQESLGPCCSYECLVTTRGHALSNRYKASTGG